MPADIAQLGPVGEIVALALREDLAAGDVTSRSTIPVETRASAVIVAKEELVLAGGAIGAEVFERVDAGLNWSIEVEDGQRVAAGTVVFRVSGSARSLIAAERTALNFMQRMSGIATQTARYVEAAGPRLRVTDTRKTQPGHRALDRYAVRCGGAVNHRNDLGAAVLIKENHVRCAGGVGAAIRSARASAPHTMRVECEVTNMDEFAEAIEAGADIVMLDNFDDAALREAVAKAKEHPGAAPLLEASGGIALERLPRLAQTGIDLVSVGALTHSVRAADLSMLVELDSVRAGG
jgi:nicotinate-nucleotide pyrophosphorylase (carboxylating)